MTAVDIFVKNLSTLDLESEAKILVAVSGGLDSMALIDLFHNHSSYSVSVAHCNFKLRAESDDEEYLIKKYCLFRNIPFHAQTFDIPAYKRRHGWSTQMAARELRYAWFRELMDDYGYTHLTTAHHSNDQHETILLQWLRGAGPRAVSGMELSNSDIIRPLLTATKVDLKEYVERKGILYLEDSSNASLDYQRNQIRHELMPVIQKWFPNGPKQMTATAAQLKEYMHWIDDIVIGLKAKITSRSGDIITYNIPPELLKKSYLPSIVWELMREWEFNFSQATEISDALIAKKTGARWNSPKVQAVSNRHTIEIRVVEQNNVVVSINQMGHSDYLGYHFRVGNPLEPMENQIYIDAEELEFPITIRSWKPGDKVDLYGMEGRKSLKKLFVDLKLSRFEKDIVPIVSDQKGILWVAPYRFSKRCRNELVSENMIQISMQAKG